MNIGVCIKWIPDTAERLELREDGKWIDTQGLEYVINRVDQCAVEKAIRIKEERGEDDEVTVFTLGPPKASEGIREAMAMGADHGVHLISKGEKWDACSTANALASFLKDRGLDLILFGNESGDSGNHQVGIRVAQNLGLPCVSDIRYLEVSNGTAICKRETEVGYEVYETELPAAFTTMGAVLATPRHASLRGIMMAKRKEIEKIEVSSEPLKLEVLKLEKLPEKRKGEIVGQGKEAVPQLIEKLEDAGVMEI